MHTCRLVWLSLSEAFLLIEAKSFDGALQRETLLFFWEVIF